MSRFPLIPLLGLIACGGAATHPAPKPTPMPIADMGPSGAGGGNDLAPGGAGQTAIRAATGGQLAMGDATLSVPAGSLAADTVITLSVVAPSAQLVDAATLRGQLYEFGPSGTRFNPPATLTLPAPAAATGMTAVISVSDDLARPWTDLVTTAAGTTLTAAVSHFSYYVVRLLPAATPTVDCGAVPPNGIPQVFQPQSCTGSPVGNWRFAAVCDFKPTPGCGQSGWAGMTFVGTITLTNQGTYSTSVAYENQSSFAISPSCNSNGKGACSAWNAFYAAPGSGGCVDDPANAGGCSCMGDRRSMPMSDSGSYLDYRMSGELDSQFALLSYCAVGDILWLELSYANTPVTGQPTFYVAATRSP